MKETPIKVILVNLLLILLCITGIEVYCYIKDTKGCVERPGIIEKRQNFDKFFKENFNNEEIFRKPSGTEYTKPSIIITGCSYGYGQYLDEKDTFGSILSEKTKRPVYNYSKPAWGIQHVYYILRNTEKVSPEPEYIFYVFFNDHIRRMFLNCNRIDNVEYLRYKNDNNVLKREGKIYNYIERFHIAGYIGDGIIYFVKSTDFAYKLFKLYMLSIKAEVNKKYPRSRLILLDYDPEKYEYLKEEQVRDLENSGITVVKLDKLCEGKLSHSEYKIPKEIDKYTHPNEKAWRMIVDKLNKKFNM